ncbi:MAG: flagellar hook-basal body complex protein FliE [Gammaproteobacteria bacterium]|jgi:flagellar hook-basal body complex protein FliE
MSVEAIDFIPTTRELAALSEAGVTREQRADGGEFSKLFAAEMQELNQQILTSESNLEKLATGEINNLHEVMMSLEKAKLSFELTLQVRNKLLEGYQEIMRMQI